MRVELEVIEGPYKGKRFVFAEPDCFLVGRDAEEGCQAHFRLERSKDMYVSRNHFILEIRPTNCFIKDNRSTNGTYIKNAKEPGFRKITTAELHDGDLIKIGKYTVFKVTIVKEVKKEKIFCIRCGEDITEYLEHKELSELSMQDYICSRCKQEEAQKAKLRPTIQQKYLCFGCKRDVSNRVNKDGRAEELHEVALYLCESCADRQQEVVEIKVIKEYRIIKELGKGGMGVVYKAWHKPTGRLVAIKKILPDVAMNRKANQLFQREMSVLSELIHPNIVRLIDQGMFGKEHYFVSEYVPDGDADNLVTYVFKGPVPVKEACEIVCHALEGLNFAHKHPKVFVHRDIKPQNILLNKTKTGQIIAKISDFGLAKSSAEAGQSKITKTGEGAAGTLLFMSPDQLLNYRFMSPPADVYSMGVTLYYLLTAKFPFDFPTKLEILNGILMDKKPKDPVLIILEDPPIPIRERNPNIPKELAKVVDKAIRKNLNMRFQTAGEFKEAILRAI